MADLTWPSSRLFRPMRFALERVSGGFVSRSQVSALLQARPTLGWYWRGEMTLIPTSPEERSEVEAVLHAWGLGDTMTFGYMGRRNRGTASGPITVSGAHVAGARTVAMTGTNGQTVKAGDMFSLGSGLYMVAEDATFSGATSIKIVGGLLSSAANGISVNFANPTAKWIRTAPPRVVRLSGHSPGIEIQFEQAR